MDVSALPYFYGVIVDVVLLLIGGFVYWKQKPKRFSLTVGLIWLVIHLIRFLLILLSAGQSAVIDRTSVVWLIRWAVVVEHSVLLFAVYPFLLENTTLGKKKVNAESAQLLFGDQPGTAESILSVDNNPS